MKYVWWIIGLWLLALVVAMVWAEISMRARAHEEAIRGQERLEEWLRERQR